MRAEHKSRPPPLFPSVEGYFPARIRVPKESQLHEEEGGLALKVKQKKALLVCILTQNLLVRKQNTPVAHTLSGDLKKKTLSAKQGKVCQSLSTQKAHLGGEQMTPQRHGLWQCGLGSPGREHLQLSLWFFASRVSQGSLGVFVFSFL